MTTLKYVKARDIMRSNVVAFTPSTSILSAIKTFEELHISSAPVIDEYGCMLGMLSASDIAKTEHMQNFVIHAEREDFDRASSTDVDDLFEFDNSEISGEDSRSSGDSSVVEWMTGDAFTVTPECGLHAICCLMVREHVHRLPVVESGKVVGIISTMDIVRCLAEGIRTPVFPRAGTSKQVPAKRIPRSNAKAAHSSRVNGKRVGSLKR